jgi:hypothetical protein
MGPEPDVNMKGIMLEFSFSQDNIFEKRTGTPVNDAPGLTKRTLCFLFINFQYFTF